MTDAILTVEQMRAAEQAAMAAGTDGWELMQRAGRGAAEWVARIAAGRPVSVLCGPGNNGGDGYVIAETLRRGGLDRRFGCSASRAWLAALRRSSRVRLEVLGSRLLML